MINNHAARQHSKTTRLDLQSNNFAHKEATLQKAFVLIIRYFPLRITCNTRKHQNDQASDPPTAVAVKKKRYMYLKKSQVLINESVV